MVMDFEEAYLAEQAEKKSRAQNQKRRTQSRNENRPVPARFKKKYEEQKAREEKAEKELEKERSQNFITFPQDPMSVGFGLGGGPRAEITEADKAFVKARQEAAIASIPIYGTIHNWDNMGTKGKAFSIALDAVDILTLGIPVKGFVAPKTALNVNKAVETEIIKTAKDLDIRAGDSLSQVAKDQKAYADSLIELDKVQTFQKTFPQSVDIDDQYRGFKSIDVIDTNPTTPIKKETSIAYDVGEDVAIAEQKVIQAEKKLANSVEVHNSTMGIIAEGRGQNVATLNLPLGEEVVTKTQRKVFGALDTSEDLINAELKVKAGLAEIAQETIALKDPLRSLDYSTPAKANAINLQAKKGLEVLEGLGEIDKKAQDQIRTLKDRLEKLNAYGKQLDQNLDNPADVFDQARINNKNISYVMDAITDLKSGRFAEKLETIQILNDVKKSFPKNKRFWKAEMFDLDEAIKRLKVSAKADQNKMSPSDFKVVKKVEDPPDDFGGFGRSGNGGGAPPIDAPPSYTPTGLTTKTGKWVLRNEELAKRKADLTGALPGTVTPGFIRPKGSIDPGESMYATPVKTETPTTSPMTDPMGDPGPTGSAPPVPVADTGMTKPESSGITTTPTTKPITTPIVDPIIDPKPDPITDPREGKPTPGRTTTPGVVTTPGEIPEIPLTPPGESMFPQQQTSTQIGTKTGPTPGAQPTPNIEPKPEPQPQPKPEPNRQKVTTKTSTTTLDPKPVPDPIEPKPDPGTRKVKPRGEGSDDFPKEKTSKKRSPVFRFRKVVAWKQGNKWITKNRKTGETKWSSKKPDARLSNVTGKGSAKESYTTLLYSNTPPTQNKLDMGAVTAHLSQTILHKAKKKRRRKK